MKVLLIIATLLPLAASMPGGRVGGSSQYRPSPGAPEVGYAVTGINDYFTKNEGNGIAKRTLVKVISAKQQTVAGKLYIFDIEVTNGKKNEICHVNVWIRLWLRAPDNLVITVDYCRVKAAVIESPKANWNDKRVQKALAAVVKIFNSRTNVDHRRLPTSGDVTRQNGGMVYEFKNVRFVETTCSKIDPNTRETMSLDVCPEKINGASPLFCNSKVMWNARSPTPFTVIAFRCRVAVIESPKANWNDKRVQKALAAVVKNFNSRTNVDHRRLPTSGDVTRQYGGMVYDFKNVRLVETTCSKIDPNTRETMSLDVCPEKINGALPLFCNSKVMWNARSPTPFTVIAFRCRAAAIESPKADWNDKRVQKALAAVVKDYNSRTNVDHRRLPTSGDVTRQYGGMVYEFKNVRLVETTCSKIDPNTRETMSLDVCPEKINGALKPLFCNSKVMWNARSPTPFTVTSSTCRVAP